MFWDDGRYTSFVQGGEIYAQGIKFLCKQVRESDAMLKWSNVQVT